MEIELIFNSSVKNEINKFFKENNISLKSVKNEYIKYFKCKIFDSFSEHNGRVHCNFDGFYFTFLFDRFSSNYSSVSLDDILVVHSVVID